MLPSLPENCLCLDDATTGALYVIALGPHRAEYVSSVPPPRDPRALPPFGSCASPCEARKFRSPGDAAEWLAAHQGRPLEWREGTSESPGKASLPFTTLSTGEAAMSVISLAQAEAEHAARRRRTAQPAA
jgi:hypothetical protein